MSQLPGTGSETAARIRRSATLPTKLMLEKRRSNEALNNRQESDAILFFHPSARIVKFAPDAPATATPLAAPSADFDYPVDTIETLPWQSPAERTVAVGRLILELPRGLSPFLKCGNVVQAILKNSQCWCVDRKSTFVLRIRSLTYYRIELPCKTPEEDTLVEQFKSALAKVLRYEVTPCPFQRGFTVPLPAEAHLPRKKRAWRPKHSGDNASPVSSSEKLVINTNNDLETVSQPHSADTFENQRNNDSSLVEADDAPQQNNFRSNSVPSIEETSSSSKRSITEPVHSVQDILARFQPIPESDSEDDVQSFHSLLVPERRASRTLSASPPTSPPDSQPMGLAPPRQRPHAQNRDISTAVVSSESTPSVPRLAVIPDEVSQTSDVQRVSESPLNSSSDSLSSSVSYKSSSPGLATTFTTGSEIQATGFENKDNTSLNLRHTQASRKRDFSPLPPASTLEYPHLQLSRKSMTSTIFHKTCSLVLVPPLQLLILLIHIASRITAGDAVQRVISNATHGIDDEHEDDDRDSDMARTPGAFRPSLRMGDPNDSLSDLE